MAQKVMEQIEVSKETIEIYKGVDAMLQAAKIGKDMGLKDVALAGHIISSGFGPLTAALDGISGVANEANEDMPEFVAAHGLGAALLGKSIAKLLK